MFAVEPWQEWSVSGSGDAVLTRHGTALKGLRWRLKTPFGAISTSGHSLPLATSSVEKMGCRGILECVRDDEALVAELGRIIQPDGVLHVVVPASGYLSWLDHMNGYRYLRDISRRGSRLLDLAEVGWRRHYDAKELADLLQYHGFEIEDFRFRGAGVAEPFFFLGEFLFRWLWANFGLRRIWRRWVGRIATVDRRIGWGQHGAWLEITARRR
jgi:SAM-dependent methyltransferase